jgi:hypothetical protein
VELRIEHCLSDLRNIHLAIPDLVALRGDMITLYEHLQQDDPQHGAELQAEYALQVEVSAKCLNLLSKVVGVLRSTFPSIARREEVRSTAVPRKSHTV